MEEINLNCGVYQIRNIVTRFCYAGQSIHLKSRPRRHWSDLKNNKHYNIHLQRSYNKHGRDKFVFEILLYCEPEELTYYEQFFVDKYVRLKISYNTCRECVDSPKGIKHSEETCKKRSDAMQGKNNHMWGKQHSEETRKKTSESCKITLNIKEIKEKMSFSRMGAKNPNFGKHLSDEAKERISKTNTGHDVSIEIRANMSKATRGENNPRSVLTSQNVLDIRKMLADGKTGASIAKIFDVNKSTISCIKTKKTWKHI